MSNDWVKDINEMHKHYKVHDAIAKLDSDKLQQFLKFRIDFLQEELDEMKAALGSDATNGAEEVVDALIDLCVVAIGTLDAFNVNSYEAWNEVLRANMNKQVGIKESRPNPLGLPDLIKPEGWTAPTHEGNHGTLDKIF